MQQLAHSESAGEDSAHEAAGRTVRGDAPGVAASGCTQKAAAARVAVLSVPSPQAEGLANAENGAVSVRSGGVTEEHGREAGDKRSPPLFTFALRGIGALALEDEDERIVGRLKLQTRR